jgi:hypothetical protein
MSDAAILDEIKRVPPDKLPVLIEFARFLASRGTQDAESLTRYGGFVTDSEADAWIESARIRSWEDEPV